MTWIVSGWELKLYSELQLTLFYDQMVYEAPEPCFSVICFIL